MKSYEVKVTCTGKPMGKPGNEEEYCYFDGSTERFDTPEQVAEWLKDQYGTCKVDPMYHDLAVDEKGNPIPIGQIFCFRNRDMSHSPGDQWYQRDWVHVVEISGSVYDRKKPQQRTVVLIQRAGEFPGRRRRK